MKTGSILVIGANGQLGSVLTSTLQERYGSEHIVASDLRSNPDFKGNFEHLDAMDKNRMFEIVQQYKIKQIYHLAAILSAKGEEQPLNTWDINMKTFFNVLEVSKDSGVEKVFYPSSIAVFGDKAPLDNTPNDAFLSPLTVYGISKASGENWAQYYYQRYGLDVRSLRYPGVIGYQSLPGGGTTDYAVDIFHKAVKEEEFTCFLEAEEKLPMIYMEDAIRATIELMEAPEKSLKIRTSYNIAGSSFSPKEVPEEIKKRLPEFQIKYNPDFRQKIASAWPNSIDDKEARQDWGWKPKYTLPKMVEEMLNQLKKQYKSSQINISEVKI